MRQYLAPLFSLYLILFSCAYDKDATIPKNRRPARIENRHTPVKKNIDALVEKEEFARALEVIKGQVKSGKSELSFRNQYVASLNGLARKGVRLFSEKDYAPAGINFRKVMNHFPTHRAIWADMHYSPEDIRSYIKTCAEKLMEEGLMEYRKGNLEKAISIWETILKFNSTYSEAKRTIDTATIQLKNLESLE